jgi:hypothetical protein
MRNAPTGLPVVESVGLVKTVVIKRPNAVDIAQFAIGVGMPALDVLMAIERRRKWRSA